MKTLTGLLLMPILYTRYSVFLFLPFLLYADMEIVFRYWFFYSVIFAFIMANCGVMKYWTKLFVKLFDIKYEVKEKWTTDILHSHTVWTHPTLAMNNKKYELSVPAMGGGLYEEEVHIRRKAIVYHFFKAWL